MKKDIRLYNVLFPVWMLLLVPSLWIVILPGNFIIDSAVFLISLKALKIDCVMACFKKYILKIFVFGMLADFLGALFMMLMLTFNLSRTAEELYLTIPAIIISALFIFIFDYFISFRSLEKKERLRLSLIFAIVTAPYTFLVPISWIY